MRGKDNKSTGAGPRAAKEWVKMGRKGARRAIKERIRRTEKREGGGEFGREAGEEEVE